MYEQANADAHQVEPVEEVLDAWLKLPNCILVSVLHFDDALRHRLDDSHMTCLYNIDALSEPKNGENINNLFLREPNRRMDWK